MPTPALALAILALLLTPGPSNTLMLLSGADRGFRATLRLVPVEVLAYLLVVAPLVLLAQAAAPHMAALRPAIALVAGFWVLALALRLWRTPAVGGTQAAVSAGQVFVTTALNPKALVFGLVLLPGTGLAGGLGLFAALVVAVALLWAALGSTLPRRDGLSEIIRRAAACWLALLSAGLIAKALSA